ncbi:MAG: hypothetical protein WCJ57_03830 [Candidatus Falkowbacteria bacterium]
MSEKDLMLDVSQAVELKMAFRRHGWSNADIKKLSEGDILGEVLAVMKKKATISYPEHLIDLGAKPFCPEGFSVEEHQGTGNWLFYLSAPLYRFYRSKKQIKGSIEGNELRKELKGQKVLNANVLDYLLAHPDLIPEEWKNKNVFFWGTIYRNSLGHLCVRYLDWDGSSWHWLSGWLHYDFGSSNPAVVAS